MAESSRRNFLALAGAGTAAVGVAAVLPAAQADAATPAAAKGPMHEGPLVAYVRDAKSGEVAVLAGEHEVVVHDRELAAKLGRIAKGGK